jgi:hypothetical protein
MTGIYSVLISAFVALLIASVGWLYQRKQSQDDQKRHAEEMELKWQAFKAQFAPHEQALDIIKSIPPPSDTDLSDDEAIPPGPYIVGLPIQDPHNFYGRKDIINKFYTRLSDSPQLTSVSIQGARRSGKTSFLRYVSHPVNWSIRLDKRHRTKTIPVFLNLQSGISNSSHFYSYLIKETIDSLALNASIDCNISYLPTKTDFPLVRDVFRTLCTKNWQFAIFLDEFEQLTTDLSFDRDFFDSLRSLSDISGIAWITSSYRNIQELELIAADGKTSPFFNIFFPVPLYLGPFSVKSAQDLIRKPAETVGHVFSEDDIAFLLSIAGRLPHAIQIAAAILYWARKSDSASSESDLYTVRSEFKAAMEKHFTSYWKHFTENERQALKILVGQGKSEDLDPHALQDLLKYGFVNDLDGQYVLLGDVFSDWVKTN